MKENAYVYGVANIRAKENSLLTGNDIEQLLGFDESAINRFLADKGWEMTADVEKSFAKQSLIAWNTVMDVLPDKHELDFLIIKNDFHNLKAALKAYMGNDDAMKYMVGPCVSDPSLIWEAIKKKDYALLPEMLQDIAKECDDILAQTLNGQLTDIMLDRKSVEAMYEQASKTGHPKLLELASLMGEIINLKTTVRAVAMKKDKVFLEEAISEMSPISKLNRKEMIQTAEEGMQAFLNYLETTPYQDAVEMIETSTTAFEKWCEDKIVQFLQIAKQTSFGPLPLAAYYMAREAEIKTVRIIVSCKRNAMPEETIRERIRMLYV